MEKSESPLHDSTMELEVLGNKGPQQQTIGNEADLFTIKSAFTDAYSDLISTLKNTDYKGLLLHWVKQPRVYIAIFVLVVVELIFGLVRVANEWHLIFVYGWVFIAFTPVNSIPGTALLLANDICDVDFFFQVLSSKENQYQIRKWAISLFQRLRLLLGYLQNRSQMRVNWEQTMDLLEVIRRKNLSQVFQV